MTQDEVRRLFIYEPDTGMLRKRNGKNPYPWHPAGSGSRYLGHTIKKRKHYLHRLVFLYHHGYLPAIVDHINNDTRDNRIENLRAATPSQNEYNKAKLSSNKTGFKGVSLTKNKTRPYVARICHAGKTIHLGYHKNKAEAAAAYRAALTHYAREFARF